MNSVMNSLANDGAPVLIPAGTIFTPDDLTFYSDRESRTLDDAIAGADLLVSCPHSGSAIPEELAEFLAPEFTRRLQFDFTDMSTSAIVRRWAEIDPRIVYVENPHPRMIRDPNRAKPENLEASLREAFARVHEAGAGNKVDLTGVDAVRPSRSPSTRCCWNRPTTQDGSVWPTRSPRQPNTVCESTKQLVTL